MFNNTYLRQYFGELRRYKVKKFQEFACNEDNGYWEQLIARSDDLYSRNKDTRNPFQRDYTRILHSQGYRRLKHKTQVFFNIENDHICTRMEHVAHVESVAAMIAQNLGLNIDLVRAISLGHDIGHAPFGHQGEAVVSKLSKKYIRKPFWHEKNGLRFVDDIELLPDSQDYNKNLALTYAVRDGIIAHCGEVDLKALKPREMLLDLNSFNHPGEYEAATWEGCVVKIADKIAYVGRDIEDAICLGFIDSAGQEKLKKIARYYDQDALNTTVIMNSMINDICENSSPEKGICLSETGFEQLKEIKAFNYEEIYKNPRLKPFISFSELVLESIFEVLKGCYASEHTFVNVIKLKRESETLAESFSKWLARYCDPKIVPESLQKDVALKCYNKKIYNNLETKRIYYQAIIDYLTGMTDRYAIKIFNELLAY